MSIAAVLRARLPGVLLCALLGLAAVGLQGLEVQLTGRAWLEALVLAILLGAAVRTVWAPGPLWTGGVDFLQGNLVHEAEQALDYDFRSGAL